MDFIALKLPIIVCRISHTCSNYQDFLPRNYDYRKLYSVALSGYCSGRCHLRLLRSIPSPGRRHLLFDGHPDRCGSRTVIFAPSNTLGAQLSLLLGYITLVQSWLSPSNLLDLTAAEKEELKACFTNDLFQLQSLQLEPDRVVCLGKCKTDRYQYIQQELQCRISHIYPERFHVVLAQRLFQPPSCYLLPVVRSQASVVVWSRILAVIGAILLAQNSWVYSLGLMGILGARELTRAKIGLRFKLSPLLTIPGGEDLPIVGMGRNLAIPLPIGVLTFGWG